MKRAKDVHAGDRLQERFGIKLDQPAYTELQGLIKNCNWEPMDIQGMGPSTKMKVKLEFRGQQMQVVFNVGSRKIVTIIPVTPKQNQDLLANHVSQRTAAEWEAMDLPLDNEMIRLPPKPKELTQPEKDERCRKDGHQFKDFDSPCGKCGRTSEEILAPDSPF